MKRAHPVITLDLGGTRTKYGVVRDGHVISSAWCPADSRGSLANHLSEIVPKLQETLSQSGLSPSDCAGVGISSTGLVDADLNQVLSTGDKYTDGTQIDLLQWGKTHFQLPVKVLNDAKCALLNEHHYGAAQGIDNVLLVTIGTGIGTASMVDGRLLKGRRHAGGNLGGHIVVNPEGSPCTCGGRGCLESEAAGWALPRLIQEISGSRSSPLLELKTPGYQEIYESAQAGDPTAQELWAHLLATWGRGITSLIHAFSPEIVILGGGVMHLGETVLSPLRETIAHHAWADFSHTPLTSVRDPDNAALIGISTLFHTPLTQPL